MNCNGDENISIDMDNHEHFHQLIFDSIARDDLNGLKNILRIFPHGLELLDNCLNTPLLYACHCGRSRVVQYLLRLGANYMCLNIFGKYSRKNHMTNYTMRLKSLV